MGIKDLVQAEQKRLTPIVKGRHVLGIQDTTELNYQNHAGRVRGLGSVGNGKDVGFFMHPMLVLDADTGGCLGSSAIHIENRLKGACKNYQKLPIEEKESYRWISTAIASKAVLCEADCVTFIGDRESDIYELIDRIPDEKTHVITRARHNRQLEDGGKLFEQLEKEALSGEVKITVSREMRNNRPEREAVLGIKFSEVVIKKSKKCVNKAASKTIRLWVVEAKEIDCPEGQEAVHWVLLTTHHVKDVEEAKQIILWYRKRWNIEQVFRTMKRQGLNIESSQVETAEGLMKLAVMTLCAAIQILQLVLARHGTTEQKTADVFSEEAQVVLESLLPQLEGKTTKQKNPYLKGNLAWATWIIARLGGWDGCTKGKHPPGPGTIGWGLQRFHNILDGYFLFKNVWVQ